MPTIEHLQQVADRLGSLDGVAERHFVAIGRSLEQAVGILAALTATFHALLGDLRGNELAQTGRDLASVAALVGTLAGSARTDVTTLRQLAGLADAIHERIPVMHAVLREVDILALNARLVAATMGEAGVGFEPFAAEIRRSAGAARDGVERLARELAGARQHLLAAGRVAAAFVGEHVGTMQAITGRLAASVASIEAHVTLSGNAASVASARSDEIRDKVAAAIVALQLGDITRQRIEHMQSACLMLSQETVPAALCCRIVAAQLLDTAEELERGTACIVEQLHELVTDAGEIARQGNHAYGASGGESGSFLDELEAGMNQAHILAHILFEHLHTAHATVNPRIAAVLLAANGLFAHVAIIRSVEADIHIMGINTSLKCGRLGPAGRPLSVISQAVRDGGRQTAHHAGAVLDALRRMVADAGKLAAADTAMGATAIDAAAQRMTGAVHRLGDIGQRMRQALTGLAGDGASVAQLLHSALEGFAVRHEIGTVLREAAATCDQPVGHATDDHIPQAMLARITAGYTMARERTVHARFAPLNGVSPIGVPVAAMADAELADVLF